MAVVLSGRITTQTVISGDPSAARTTAGPKGGRRRPNREAATNGALLMRKERRVIFGIAVMVGSLTRWPWRPVDRFAHLLEGAAATDVIDGGVDVGVGRQELVLRAPRPPCDHAGLAVAALRYVVLQPRLLHLVVLPGEAFDGGDLGAARRTHGDRTGAHREAVRVHGARAALGDAAPHCLVPVRPTCSRMTQSRGVVGRRRPVGDCH
jgi:hypothetical protein